MSSHRLILLSSALIGALLLQPTTTSPIAQIPSAPVSAPPQSIQAPVVEPDYGQLPLYFVENQGQMDELAAYYVQGSDKTIYFSPGGVTFSLTARETVTNTDRAEQPAAKPARRDEQLGMDSVEPIALQRWTVKLDFVGANPNVHPVAEEQAEAVFSYFTGRPDEWHAGLRSYHKLVYPELWPGIDLVYYGTVNQMKYEFIVRPGADPDQIRLAYRGATDVRLNAAGQMEVSTPIGGFRDDTPVA